MGPSTERTQLILPYHKVQRISSQLWTAAALHKTNEIHTSCRITVIRVNAPRTTKATEVLAGSSVWVRILKKMYATTEMRLIVSDMDNRTLQQMAKRRHDRFSNFTLIVNICMALERICQRIHKAKPMSELTIMPGSNRKQAARKKALRRLHTWTRDCGENLSGLSRKMYAPNTVIKGVAIKSD